jgi:hypothetical protein
MKLLARLRLLLHTLCKMHRPMHITLADGTKLYYCNTCCKFTLRIEGT